MAAAKYFYGTGRRKTSSARVFVKPGKGKVTINNKDLEKYFHHAFSINSVYNPLNLVNMKSKLDVRATVIGGGETGQAEAISLGLSRALVAMDETSKEPLKAAGLLTRDPRMVERKKYGLRGARRRGQYSKR